MHTKKSAHGKKRTYLSSGIVTVILHRYIRRTILTELSFREMEFANVRHAYVRVFKPIIAVNKFVSTRAYAIFNSVVSRRFIHPWL